MKDRQWNSVGYKTAFAAMALVLLIPVAGCKEDKRVQELESDRQQLQFTLENKDDQIKAARRESVAQTRKIKDLERRLGDLLSENTRLRQDALNDPNRSKYMVDLERENLDLKALNEAMSKRLNELSGGVVLNQGSVDERVQALATQVKALSTALDESKLEALRVQRENRNLQTQNEDLRAAILRAREGSGGTSSQDPVVRQDPRDPKKLDTVPPRQSNYVEQLEENIPRGNHLPGPAVYHAEDYARALRNSLIPGQEKVTWNQGFEVHFNDGKWLFHKTEDEYLIEFQGKVDEHFIKHFPHKNIKVPVGSSVVFIWNCNPKDKTVTLQSIHIGKSQVTGNLSGLYATLAELY